MKTRFAQVIGGVGLMGMLAFTFWADVTTERGAPLALQLLALGLAIIAVLHRLRRIRSLAAVLAWAPQIFAVLMVSDTDDGILAFLGLVLIAGAAIPARDVQLPSGLPDLGEA